VQKSLNRKNIDFFSDSPKSSGCPTPTQARSQTPSLTRLALAENMLAQYSGTDVGTNNLPARGSSSTTSGLGESMTTSTTGCSASSLYPPTIQASPGPSSSSNLHGNFAIRQHLLPHLQPQRFQQVSIFQISSHILIILFLQTTSSASASPTSTCSSPLVPNSNQQSQHLLLIDSPQMATTSSIHLPAPTTITPPQSAPPQKTSSHSFFMDQLRIRSKSRKATAFFFHFI
jgi:hypothetical protein